MGLLHDMALRFQNYGSQGALFTLGYMPETGFRNFGTESIVGGGAHTWGGTPFARTPSQGFGRPSQLTPFSPSQWEDTTKVFMARHKAAGFKVHGVQYSEAEILKYYQGIKPSGWKMAGSALGPAISAYFLYQGYKGEFGDKSGVAGMAEAGIWDVAVSASVMHHTANLTKATTGAAALTRSRGIFSMLRIALGAGLGASMGQSMLGAPGAFFGGYVGGLLTRHPIVAAASALTIGGGYLVGKGAFSLLKTGYRQRQDAKLIHTAGDTAAFFTQNAMTMRSRAVQQMRNSHLNARSALGGEANFMHMPRNYFSSYR